MQSYVDGERVTFSDGEVRQIFCRVNGSNPAPQVRVFANDIDITHHFTQSSQLITVGPAVTKGLQVMNMRINWLIDWLIDWCRYK